MSKYSLDNLLEIAKYKLDPDMNSLEGLKLYLKSWFAIKFNTTEYDPRIQELTVEELLIRYYMQRMHDDPDFYNRISNKEEDDYEEWLKEQMADDYKSIEEQAKSLQKHEEEFTKKIREKYPDEIKDTFSRRS